MVKNKFKFGNLEFTLTKKTPTDEMFQQMETRIFSVCEVNNYKVWLTGGFLEDWETNDIDLILTGEPNYEEVKNLLYQQNNRS